MCYHWDVQEKKTGNRNGFLFSMDSRAGYFLAYFFLKLLDSSLGIKDLLFAVKKG